MVAGSAIYSALQVLLCRHPPSFCLAGVACGDIHLRFACQVWHLGTSTCVSRLLRLLLRRLRLHFVTHTPSFTHHLTHTTLSHTIFLTPSDSHNFVFSHHLAHTTLSHTISLTRHLTHTTLSHTIFLTPSRSHNFVTHHLTHTTLSHTAHFAWQALCHTSSFTHI